MQPQVVELNFVLPSDYARSSLGLRAAAVWHLRSCHLTKSMSCQKELDAEGPDDPTSRLDEIHRSR